jgi:hypothetical protein
MFIVAHGRANTCLPIAPPADQQLLMNRIYHRGFTPKSDSIIGIFDMRCSPARIVKSVYRQAAEACKSILGNAPAYVPDSLQRRVEIRRRQR